MQWPSNDQLAQMDQKQLQKYQKYSKNYINNAIDPRNSLKTSKKVNPGDILVSATDGFWSNVFDDEVREVL